MPKEITARAKVQTDKKGLYYLHIDNMDWWRGELSKFGPGVPVKISIKKFYNKRSLDQNGMFHWYVGILADYFGYANDTMKRLIGLKWLKEPVLDTNGEQAVDVVTGELLFDIRSTADLDRMEMAELCREMREWAELGWGIILPEPDKNYKLNFKQQK